MNWRFVVAACAFLLVLSLGQRSARAEELPDDVQKSVDKGLDWLARTQNRDGHWDANGQYPTTMTGLGGMCFLMEGSTLREGRYADNIRRAVDWCMERAQPNGLIGNPNNPTEAGRYMYGHGFCMLFLASAYGEEEDNDRRKKLEKILTKAVEFSGKAQTDRGGYGYVSAADGGGFDEGSVTVTQLQGLRAAKNAGIVVPKSIIDKSMKYLSDCTTERGGIIYSLAHGGAIAGQERPALTVAAIASSFSAGNYDNKLARKWFGYCKNFIGIGGNRMGHDEYMHYYYAQALYMLGDDGYAKFFPEDKNTKEYLNWSKYRKEMHNFLLKSQAGDGSWGGGYIGNHFATCVYLTILQLDNGTLPIYQR